MDRNYARNLLLTGFKPREQDIDTPYLGELDGHLKLVGLTGKQSIDLENQATEQTIDKEGNATNRVNWQKFAVLAIQACLRMRDTGETLLNKADVLGEHNDGDGEFLAIDDGALTPLMREVMAFLGKRPAKEKKANSAQTPDGSNSSSSQPDSAEPSASSSMESTQPS